MLVLSLFVRFVYCVYKMFVLRRWYAPCVYALCMLLYDVCTSCVCVCRLLFCMLRVNCAYDACTIVVCFGV